MAPRTAQTAPEAHTLKTNGHPSSATIANRIASQFATNLRRPQNQDRESFESLLREILEDDTSLRQTDSENGDSSAVNVRLICVIVQAGLGAPPAKSSDEERESRLADVTRSLRAIDSIVSRCPVAIFKSLDGAVTESTCGLPLFAWLIPRLLGEVRDLEFQDPEQHVLGILKRLVLAEQVKQSRLDSCPISTLLYACIEDLLASIEATSVPTDGKFKPGSLSSKSWWKIYPGHRAIEEGHSSVEVVPRTVPQAFMIVIILLLGFLPDPDSVGKAHSSDWLLAQLEKILGGLKRSWNALSASPYVTARTLDGCLYAHLRCVRLLFLCLLNTSVDSKNVTKTGILMSQMLSFTLAKDASISKPAVESEVCAALFNLLSISQQSNHPLDSPNQEACSRSGEYDTNDAIDGGPRKRLRLDHSAIGQSEDDISSVLKSQILRISGLPLTVDVDEINPKILDTFPNLKEADQCVLLNLLGYMACAQAKTLQRPNKIRRQRSKELYCSKCDGQWSHDTAATFTSEHGNDQLTALVADLTKLPQMHKTGKPRIAAMLAARRALGHCTEKDHLDLTTSVLGQSCLQALRSSSRDLRIAAGRTIPMFLSVPTDEMVSRRNRVSALDFLRNLSEKSELALQETCILAWGQIARITSGDETNIVLLRLVEYLGHTNPLVSPYWRTLAPTVVQDLQRRPQIAQYLSDLLSMTVSELLRLTQSYTLPYLVLTKQQDILQRVADACGSSIKDVCMDHTNMSSILAYIILRTTSEAEFTIMTAFEVISSDFANVNCSELVKTEPVLIASELLKAAGDAGEAFKSRAYEALYFLTSLMYGRHGTPRGIARKSNGTGSFFENHVLGIMAHLSDIINESKGLQVATDKIRCLRAIQEMMRIARDNITNALPQISACLRSAIETPELRNEAFLSWMVMMETVGADEVIGLIDPTFAIIVQYWSSFTPHSQGRAHDMISQLLTTQAASIREMPYTIPSLASIPLMSKFEAEIQKIKLQMAAGRQLQALIQRCRHENLTVVLRALVELETFLEAHQSFLHEITMTEQQDPMIAELARTLLDISVHFNDSHDAIVTLSARCLGLLGCLDPTRTEAPGERREMLVLSNFQEAEQTIDFVVFFLREVLVKAFLSATNPRAQGFLAYAMQELLKFCGLNGSVIVHRNQERHANSKYLRWHTLPESVRNNLTPFLNSKYVITAAAVQPETEYPIYRPGMAHGQWLRGFVYDLLRKGDGENITELFQVFSRIIRTQDTPISAFLLPFAVLNIIISGSESQQMSVGNELLTILSHDLPERDIGSRNSLIQCSQNVFQVLDYLSRWLQGKRKEISTRASSSRHGRTSSNRETHIADAQIHNIESVIKGIPAEVISRRAVECRSYARALFYWEQYIRQQRLKDLNGDRTEEMEPLYERLQQIYTQIDEPDGIEGISSHLQVLNIDQQVLEHRKAGRWTAAQSCFRASLTSPTVLLPFACEASWVTGRWDKLQGYLAHVPQSLNGNFNIGVGRTLLALAKDPKEAFAHTLDDIRRRTAKTLNATNTTSLQACHDVLLKLHALTEVEAIGGIRKHDVPDTSTLVTSLDHRLELLGPFMSDKQYVLGLRRAAMQLSMQVLRHVASAWLTSARLARKAGFVHQSFNAVLHASQLGDNSATIEHSRLLWKEGHHRKAIQSLRGAIAANAFQSHEYLQTEDPLTVANNGIQQEQNVPKSRAHLLLAKWVDGAGQTQSGSIIQEYRQAIKWYSRWEKVHYYLGKHYNKLFEHEKAKPVEKRAQTFLGGEMARLVVENYLRSLALGAKYIYQTLPRALTLWLELGVEVDDILDSKYGTDDFRTHITQQRQKMLDAANRQVKKYCDRLPPFVFYTALSQIVARIVHPNPTVHPLLVAIVAKVVGYHPQQALWTLLAVVKSSSKNRALRGRQCLDRIYENAKRAKSDADAKELRTMITHGQKLSDQLLHVCEGSVEGKSSAVSLTKDLGFVHRTAACKLVVPLESTLTAALPQGSHTVDMKKHRAFAKETVTISSFLDHVLVLNSLQKPRKITIRGSDGRLYALLCKPKDDLRKDQRLMEFNAMINRFLKKDAESSRRRLYIKTYAVTPLNEECGLIEWVDNLKTLREILLNTYNQKGVPVQYGELKALLNEASSPPIKPDMFTEQILAKFPSVFHEWFVDMFPEPGAWFTARLRYTRSCAVMSIVGHVLGLGDRHGENILFEEGNGGTFHVDFNCLFDKGLTFEKPELVPFRLTHNMVDAFGAYGYEGPFRKSCELTARILRQHEDTLMTILETFLYDPTTDFIGKKKKNAGMIPDTPEGVLDSVRSKVRGLLPLESVPLSVEGYVDELIEQATDPKRLLAMYIGWCAFF
ncbi:MAG: hypothetical protein LQ350_007823 [Teloschistes chrysophthalmus]|nr:MAG: hypothetical protein LQ350_007823 [Niorma chrysophthalma]